MLHRTENRKNAFTLVELIVVIAIISILAAVLIPSLSKFIDNGRYSNDVQVAKSMTSIIEGHRISDPGETYDTFSVKNIINDYHGSTFDFTPKASNTGYFYIEETHEVRAMRYDEAASLIEEEAELEYETKPYLLSSQTLDASGFQNSPEELFGKGGYLLTTEGSAIAMAVGFVRNMAESQSTIAKYSEVVSALNTVQSNEFIRFFLGDVSDETLDRARDMVAYYNPQYTLFVNNSSWATTGTDDKNKILFAPGISNVPQFNINDAEYVGDEVVLPKTIRTISSGAFSGSAFSNEALSFRLTGSAEVLAEPNAFSSELIGKVDFNVVVGEIGLVDYSDKVSIVYDEGEGEYTYSFTNLPIRDQVTGYAIEVSGSVVTVKIYTANGLVGYATNLKIINYYLSPDDAYPYFRFQSVNDTFFLPQDPTRTDYDFIGWHIDPDGSGDPLAQGDPITDRFTNVYAKWGQ